MLFSLLAQVRNDSAVFCWAQSHLHLTHDVICMMKRFRGFDSQLQQVTKHLLCFCFLLPINLCVLRPFQGALWHARNLSTIPYSFILPILPVNCSSLLSSSLISLYARHQSTRTTPIPWIAIMHLQAMTLRHFHTWKLAKTKEGLREATWLLQTTVWCSSCGYLIGTKQIWLRSWWWMIGTEARACL